MPRSVATPGAPSKQIGLHATLGPGLAPRTVKHILLINFNELNFRASFVKFTQ